MDDAQGPTARRTTPAPPGRRRCDGPHRFASTGDRIHALMAKARWASSTRRNRSVRGGVSRSIIRPGVATPAMLRRFEHEYEFLGRLQHPGIAQIYQAGVADTGSGPQPYFAMELVRGRRLDD